MQQLTHDVGVVLALIGTVAYIAIFLFCMLLVLYGIYITTGH